MATILPRNPTILEALSQAGGLALPGLVAGAQGRATQQFAQQQGLDIPFGLPQDLTQALLTQALAPGLTEQAKPFTLGPGQQRFDPGGQSIASVPVAAKPETVGQIRAEEIRKLQAIPPKQRTIAQKASLKKLLEGTPLVEIGFGKPAAASERTAIAETRASLDALDNLKVLFENTQVVTGPIVGRILPIKGLLGLTTDEQEDLFAATAAFKNKVIKDITGAQMSEQEANRIMKQIPLETDPPARWRAKEKQTRKNLQFIQKRRAEVLRQSGLRVPENQQLQIPSRENLTPADLDNLTLEQLQGL